jgi:hypothetical protein
MFTRMVLDGISMGLYLAHLKFGFLMAVPRAHIAFYQNLGKMKAKRRQLQAIRKIDQHKECYKGSIVIGYYLLKRKIFSNLKQDLFKQ